jgi:hypothetical protein
MNSSEGAIVFRLFDEYSRKKHHCFIVEFFPERGKSGYILCFRPTDGTKDSPNRYAYRYLHIGSGEIQEAAKNNELPASVTELLDKELPSLGRLV